MTVKGRLDDANCCGLVFLLAERVQSSFRDPAGFVFTENERVYRAVTKHGWENWHIVKSAPVVDALKQSNDIIDFWTAKDVAFGSGYVHEIIEHPKLPFISYPYEWSFQGLKAAALHHLDVHIKLLASDITLSDASAYNIQFVGAKPVFIDVLSLKPYEDGEIWAGMNQFTEQFLTPLLLSSYTGIPSNAIYRGGLEGLPINQLKQLTPFGKKFSWRHFKYITLPTAFTNLNSGSNAVAGDGNAKLRTGLPKTAFLGILKDLRNWVLSLKRKSAASVWGDYGLRDSYDEPGTRSKQNLVQEFAQSVQPNMLWDMGCNNGAYTKLALQSGAVSAIGWEADQNAVDAAFEMARIEKLNFLPLFVDLANPSPDQGWSQSERAGLRQRATADAVMALAVVHHLAIGRNIPLDWIGDWLGKLAPNGLVEFIPKEDPQIQRMLSGREDVFHNYDRDALIQGIEKNRAIVSTTKIDSSGRELIWFAQQT